VPVPAAADDVSVVCEDGPVTAADQRLGDLAALDVVTDRLAAVLGGGGGHQWGQPTPCEGWDVAALVDHVTGGNRFTVSVLAGRSAEQAMADAIASFGDGHASVGEATTALAEQHAAFGRPGALDGTCDHLAGPLPTRTVLRLRLHDLIVHTWDVEQSLRPPADIPPAVVHWGLHELTTHGSLDAAGFGPDPEAGGRGPEPPQVRYLGRFGRL